MSRRETRRRPHTKALNTLILIAAILVRNTRSHVLRAVRPVVIRAATLGSSAIGRAAHRTRTARIAASWLLLVYEQAGISHSCEDSPYTPMQVGVGTQVVTTVETGVVNVLVTQCSVPMQASASPHPSDAVDFASIRVRTIGGHMSKLLVHTSHCKRDQDNTKWFGEKHIDLR